MHTDVVKYLEFKAVDGSYVFVKGKVLPALRFRGLRGQGSEKRAGPVHGPRVFRPDL